MDREDDTTDLTSDRSRDRLRFKRRSQNSSRKRSRSRKRRYRAHHPAQITAQQDALDKDDEAFYASGAAFESEPSLLATLQNEDFREHLFDALADEEGREHWQQVYGQPIHDFERPEMEMTDDEYAAYVRRGMWDRTHKEEAQARRVKEETETKERANRAKFIENENRIRRSKEHLQFKKKLEARWKVYLQAWEELGQSQWSLATIPWPLLQAEAQQISRTSIEAFLSFAGNVKSIAREELRRRWHPDRFQQRAIKHVMESARIEVLRHVTTIAQILNEIIDQ